MDSFELNKIAGAVLGALLFVLGVGILSEIIFEPDMPEKPGYEIAVAEQQATTAQGAPAEQAEPLPVLLAAGDPARGETAARKCQACHTFEQGGANKVGPNLHNVVGATYGHTAGFAYSKAMQEAKAAGKTWTYEDLDDFITNPRGHLPGTAMAFAGISKATERADVIAYLRTVTENPPPLPEPETAAAPQSEAAPAGDAQPQAGQDAQQAQPGAAQPAQGAQDVQQAQPAQPQAGQEAQPAQPGAAQPTQTGQDAQQAQPAAPAPAEGAAPAGTPSAPAAGTTAPTGDTAQQPGSPGEVRQAPVGTQSGPSSTPPVRSAVPPMAPVDNSGTANPAGSAGDPSSPTPTTPAQ